MKIYLRSAAQISIQAPLSEAWMDEPMRYEEAYVRAIEPEYRTWIPPMESRRMGKVLKRALATSLKALEGTDESTLDGIFTGTGLGCIEHTEKFLTAMVRDGEELLTPTYFMQSTHNTISSQVALRLKCHGYNATYSHLGVSFESALMDAWQQFLLGEVRTVLVEGHDEMTPAYFDLLEKVGRWKSELPTEKTLRRADTPGSFAGETAVSMLLSSEPSSQDICVLRGVELLHCPSDERLSAALDHLLSDAGLRVDDLDAVMCGYSGDRENDACYRRLSGILYPKVPQLWYKHIFGESFTVSGIGMYAAAHCVRQQRVPSFLIYDAAGRAEICPRHLLVHHHYAQRNHFLALLSVWDV